MAQKVRAVLTGCGSMSQTWLQAARDLPQLEIVGLVDLAEAAAHGRAEQYGLDRAMISTQLEDVLACMSPDVVFDVTVPEAHYDVTMAALAHGCHVLGEKPMADSLPRATQMVEAARAAGRIYAVIQNRRYNAKIRHFQAMLQAGGIGRLTTLASDFYIGAHFGGFRDQMAHVLLLDMAIHTFDAARFLTGADPVAVYCKEWNPAGSWYAHGASAVAVFEMTGDIVYTYRGSWCAEGLNTSWDSAWRALCDGGSATWDGESAPDAAMVVGRGGFISETAPCEPPTLAPGDKVDGHASIIREFVRCVESGATPETVCTDNIKSLAMVFAAIKSAETGARVAVTW